MYTATKRTAAAPSSLVLLTTLHVMLVAVTQSRSIAVITAVQTSSLSSNLDNRDAKDTYSDVGESQQYLYDDIPQHDETDAFERLVNSEKTADVLKPIANELLLVTVLKESRTDGQECVFWVDDTLVYMTVTVEHAEPSDWVIVDQYGARVRPIISTWGTKRWTVHRPTVGVWHVHHEGATGYTVSVRGASSVDLEVSLYHTDITTGLAEIVYDTPTAGQQIRTIIDVIGGDVISNMYNVTLVTSDGTEVASDWLRPAGVPQDSQYETTFTWPTQPVYVRVYGRELNGNLLERQTPFKINPVLFDLRLLGNPLTTGVVSADGPLVLEYVLTNHGPSGTFVLDGSLDNRVFSAVVSPAQIRLGHLGSFVGSVTVSVKRHTSVDSTGMLTVNARLITKPSVIQSTTRFLTSHSDVTDHDHDPPFCETASITGNCLEQDATSSPSCHLRHWVVRASLDDAGSGLSGVTFDDFTHKEMDVRHDVASFTKGQANEPVDFMFNATCCIPEVTLNALDVAKNQATCYFYRSQMVTVPPTPFFSRSPPPLSAEITTARLPPKKQPSTPTLVATSRRRPELSSSTASPSGNAVSLHHAASGRPTPGSTRSTTLLNRPVSKLMSSNGVATESTFSSGSGGDVNILDRTTTDGGGNGVDGRTRQSTMLGDGFAAMDTVTRQQGGKKNQRKTDYSTLKTASIILGSIGGVAGLGIGVICLVVYLRHRRLQQRQRHGSSNSSSSRSSSDSNTSGNDAGATSRIARHSRRDGGGVVPDLVPATSALRHPQLEFSTPL